MSKLNLELLWQLVKSDFKTRNSNSILGFVWILLLPFFNFLILFFVFSYFRGGDSDEFLAPKIMYGIITFNFLRDIVIQGSNSLINSKSIISKIYFSRFLVLNASFLVSVTNLLVNFVVATVIFLIWGKLNFNLGSFFWLIFTFAQVGILGYTIVHLTSVVNGIIRDISRILQLIFQALFWLSGIFYDISTIQSEFFQSVLIFNPLAFFIDSVKAAAIQSGMENVQYQLILLLITLAFYPFVRYFFKIHSDNIIDKL